MTYVNLVMYQDQGRLAEAEELQVKVMERGIAKLGEAHPHTLIYLGNLARTYRDQGRLTEADALLALHIKAKKRDQG
jgi:hypothetical protein